MEKNELKKLLYRENPVAELRYIRKGKAYYEAKAVDIAINFEIPVEDMGDANFLAKMDGKLLIRWII